MNLTTTGLFGGAAIFGIISSSWGYIKMIISRIMSLIIVRIKLDKELTDAMSLYCWNELSRSPFGIRQFISANVYVRPRKKNSIVVTERISDDPIIFWNGWKPLFFGMDITKSSGGGSSTTPYVTFFRGTWKLEKLLFEITEKYNDAINDINQKDVNKIKRFIIRHRFGSIGKGSTSSNDDDNKVEFSDSSVEKNLKMGMIKLIGYEKTDIGYESKTKNPYITYLAFPDKINKLINEITYWLKSEEWYSERAIPWKRGWLLYGKPGTGKTSLVRALAEYLDLPLHVFDLSTMTNEDLTMYWKNMLGNTPCIALFEDLDNIFEGRKNIKNNNINGNALSFDCLLNIMDGVEKSDGVLTIITTNRIDKLDEAIGIPRTDGKANGSGISTRPGRIDKVMELGLIDETCRWKLAERILKEWPDVQKEIVKSGDGDTPAQFQERCSQLALNKKWENEENNNIDKIKEKYSKREQEKYDRNIEELPCEESLDIINGY